MTEPRGTVLVASGDRLAAGAARRYLDRQPHWRVTGTAHDGLQALALIGRLPPSAVLVIGDLPRLGPPALAAQVRRRWPEVSMVFVGSAATPHASVLPADAGGTRVLAALAEAPRPVAEGDDEEEHPEGVALLGRLTPRERVVLKMIAAGMSSAEIGAQLGVSQHTIRTHMQNLYAKLGLHSRLEILRFATRHGIVSAESAGTSD